MKFDNILHALYAMKFARSEMGSFSTSVLIHTICFNSYVL